MKTYIARLNSEHYERDLIKTFKNELQNVEVCYNFQNFFYGELILKKEVKGNLIIRVYHLTDYSCDVVNEVNYNKSANEILDSKVKNIYIAFMGRKFPDYKENYLKNVDKKSDKLL